MPGEAGHATHQIRSATLPGPSPGLTDDANATALHIVLCHLEHQETYARLLFDYSSAFNTISPSRLYTAQHLPVD